MVVRIVHTAVRTVRVAVRAVHTAVRTVCMAAQDIVGLKAVCSPAVPELDRLVDLIDALMQIDTPLQPSYLFRLIAQCSSPAIFYLRLRPRLT